MGASCCKAGGANGGTSATNDGEPKGTLHVMFDRIDKEKKGFISMKNLEDLMRDDKTYFQGKDTSHIMEKYGSNNQMTFEQFNGWWGSTYTTYGDEGNNAMNLSQLVSEVNNEQQQQQKLDPIAEISENMSEAVSSKHKSADKLDALAVTRS